MDEASPLINGVAISHHSTNCITLTNNKISNVVMGTAFNADHSLYDSNTTNNYADDAVDYSGNYLTLSNNKISNVLDTGNGNHNDSFQGFLPGGSGYNASIFTDVTIDHNLIIRQTDPNLPFPTVLQGIDNFDGDGERDWYNMQITNNTIITNTYNAITFGGIHNSIIANNTALADGMVTSCLVAGEGAAPVKSPGNITNIVLNNYNHFSHISTNNKVINNVATNIEAYGTDPSNIVSNNLAEKQLALYLNGKQEYFSKPGTYGSHNILDPTFVNNMVSVQTISTTHGPLLVYNTTWKPNTPYVGMGNVSTTASAPAYTGTLTLVANARQVGTPSCCNGGHLCRYPYRTGRKIHHCL
jgi:hypothetical protein